MSLSTVQAAVVALVNQSVALVVAFGVVNNTLAGVIISTTTALVNTAFVVGQALENHGKAKAAAGPAVVVNPPAAAPAAKGAK